MKRTKQWWTGLNKDERSELIYLERSEKSSHQSGYLPDDCSECGACSYPVLGTGLCPNCENRRQKLILKANQKCLS